MGKRSRNEPNASLVAEAFREAEAKLRGEAIPPAPAPEDGKRERRRSGPKPGRIRFKTRQDASAVLRVLFNEIREGRFPPAIASNLIQCINSFINNERITEQMARKAEEEALIAQIQQYVAANERLRTLLVERGIISPTENVPGMLNG